jgi:bacteriorhodopsin
LVPNERTLIVEFWISVMGLRRWNTTEVGNRKSARQAISYRSFERGMSGSFRLGFGGGATLRALFGLFETGMKKQVRRGEIMETGMFTISVEGFEIVSHILTLGYASMAAAMLFFILTKNDSLPKFQMSSVISVVVMVSALLLLYTQKMSWIDAYAFNGSAYALKEGADLFTNGYRYLNWLIDVPMLLIQILFVAGITGAARASYMTRFTISGALMIITGYIGQFYEPGRLNESVTLWAFWGLVSTAFFIYVLVLITRVINDGKSRMEGSPRKLFGRILPLFYVAWWLYPIAYVAPILMQSGVSYELTIVGQQVIYTIADIASKVVYGVMLTATAIMLSEQQQGVREA